VDCCLTGSLVLRGHWPPEPPVTCTVTMKMAQWSADFADPDAAMTHAEGMATPWLGINHDCNRAINAEVKQELRESGIAARCRALDLPVLIVDGPEDIRPRSGVDSLEKALPNCERVSLPGSGHLPWVENPHHFRRAVATFLDAAV
ncbi:alpha/beta fold hydrolase, partial [Micromonospora tulbaghiae]|uniref:alpha/beta fold hydrolase n=1 Tax=Micromonospora tulbaghiae TaxID=479978 RepID=UPI003659D4EA